MAPLKMTKNSYGIDNAQPTIGVCTRSRNGSIKNMLKQAVGKRKAGSPLREVTAKRAAFGDITNAITNIINDKNTQAAKKVIVTEANIQNGKIVKKKQDTKRSIVSKITKQNVKTNPTYKSESLWPVKNNYCQISSLENATLNSILKIQERPIRKSLAESVRSNDEVSEESLYISANEDISNDSKQSININKTEKESSLTRDINLLVISDREVSCVPKDVIDFDKENWDDHFQVSHYASDIFNYLKSREADFVISDYLPSQKFLTNWMRSLLIDWMVEVQESFELNHETLYLAVKLVDLYLSKVTTKKDELQLLGAAALFIASKFDERIPPLISDFLYICDGAYNMRQLLNMEIELLKTIGFDLGIPLSYRFLRRYARCARVTMPTLTLARFILELCLMEYSMISISDSKMAAAALYLAIKMKKLGTWTSTHIYYTGYNLEDIMPVVRAQNACLNKKPKEALSTVRNKYSHRIFFEVAKIPLLADCDLT